MVSRQHPYRIRDAVVDATSCSNGATENARAENDGVENDGQILKELQGLENAGLENDGQNFSNLRTKLRGLENAVLQK